MSKKMKNMANVICLIILTLSFPVLSQETNSESNDKTSSEQNRSQEVKERKYVTDKLRLSLYKNAESKSGTLKLLISGDVLDVLERSGPYSKVRTIGGIIGWVKNGFLVSIPTASFLLIEEQKKNEQLSTQLDKLSNTQKIVDDYENTIQKMNSDNESALLELANTQQEFDKISELNSNLKEELESYTAGSSQISLHELLSLIQHYWYVLLGVILFLFLVGFLMGKEMVEARIRKRFQGVKVL